MANDPKLAKFEIKNMLDQTSTKSELNNMLHDDPQPFSLKDIQYVHLSKDVKRIIDKNPQINDWIDHTRDLLHDDFSKKTLERSYLAKNSEGKVVESIQAMWMRVALGIHGEDLDKVRETYDLLSRGFFTHATPTLFNSGTVAPQNSSCFLLSMKEDSINGIFDTIKDCALISKRAGGIGVHMHQIRATGAPIHSTNGVSNGILPMLRCFNATARYVDQGGGRRKGSFCFYLAPWHLDIEDFLELRKNTGIEDNRCRDLFTALWVSDLFMERVEADQEFTLFCPSETRDLPDLVGEEFKRRYEAYERDPLIKRSRKIKARDLWVKILSSVTETGTPFICSKDSANRKSNQQNLGTIHSSNLCTEIYEYSDANETAVCNLASVALPRFATPDGFNFAELDRVVRVIVRNLNRIIDHNLYPTKETKTSNLRHRPVGIGVQGLADVFAMRSLPFGSKDAIALDRAIFEAIYFAAIDESCKLAEEFGHYETFSGSPLSKGQFQFDLWGIQPSQSHDWEGLRSRVQQHGTRNSLLTAVMPTASTAQILGNSESVEPRLSNVYVRRTLAGTFQQFNPYLKQALEEKGLWSDTMRRFLIANRGSIQDHPNIDDHTKAVFRTVWEIKQRGLIDHAAARGPFIDQGQSRSLYFGDVTDSKLSSAIFYAWRKGLKTLVYYTRTRPAWSTSRFESLHHVC